MNTSGSKLGAAIKPKATGARVLLIAGLTVVLAAGWFLSRMHGMQRLGQPAVKLVTREVFDENGEVVANTAIDLPTDLPGYQATNLPLGRIELNWLPKDTTYGRTAYTAPDGFRALLGAVLMGRDRTSIHKPEYCLVGQGFTVDSQTLTHIPISAPIRYELPVMKMVTTRETKLPDGTVLRSRALYVYWFVADQRLSADHNKRMLTMAWDLVTTGVMQRWAYISCLGECEFGQEEKLFARMAELIAAAVPKFQLTTGEPGQMAGKR
jgi:hypothetical protein